MFDEFLKNYPELSNMDSAKLNFILNFAQKSKPSSMNDAMPFLMANMTQAKQSNIHFSNTEIRLIADILCKNLPENEKMKVKQVINMIVK